MPGIATVLYNDILRPRKRLILYVFLIVVFSLATYFAIQTLVKPRMAFYENFGSDISNDNSREQQATIMAFSQAGAPTVNLRSRNGNRSARTFRANRTAVTC